MNILVVDDSRTTRLIAKKTLASLNCHSVLEAEDGVQAAELFVSNPVDVVFTDWNMPNMDGLTLLKSIRMINREVLVIMVTTEGARSKVLEAIQYGVNDYLVKPFTPVMLKEKLAKWVQVPVQA
ncbi:MAG: response regulator [Planctomycetaceae bacterium]